jgi:hypothetical protein
MVCKKNVVQIRAVSGADLTGARKMSNATGFWMSSAFCTTGPAGVRTQAVNDLSGKEREGL